MKKLLFAIMVLALVSTAFVSAKEVEKTNSKSSKISGPEKELFVLLTSGDKEVLTKVVGPYLTVSAKAWEKRTLVIWGPSEKTIAENPDLQEMLKKLKEGGVTLKACKWCAEQYSVADKLSAMGFEVAYMGNPLTEALQNNLRILVF